MPKFKKTLPCELTTAEWTEQAELAAKLIGKLGGLLIGHAVEKKRMKAAEASLEERIQTALDAVRTRSIEREVACEWQPDRAHAEMVLFRLDDDRPASVVETRPMTDAEVKKYNQRDLPIEQEQSSMPLTKGHPPMEAPE